MFYWSDLRLIVSSENFSAWTIEN